MASARLELRAQVVEAAHSRRDRLACAGLAARALRVAARHGQGRHLPAADARQAQAEHRKLSVRHSRVSRRTDRPSGSNATSNRSAVMTPVTGVPGFPLPGVLCAVLCARNRDRPKLSWLSSARKAHASIVVNKHYTLSLAYSRLSLSYSATLALAPVLLPSPSPHRSVTRPSQRLVWPKLSKKEGSTEFL